MDEVPKNEVLVGDVMDRLNDIPDESVDMVVTSPPYWGLRSYSGDVETVWDGEEDCEHEWAEEDNYCQKCDTWKGQLGLEPKPELYVKHLTDIFREIKRVLKPSGTAWLNLGDTYAGSGNGYGSDPDPKWEGARNDKKKAEPRDINIPAKNLVGIPWRVAFALQKDGWYLRNDIIWHKPNPMPKSVKDRCTTSHEHIFLLSKNKQYFYDADAVREPHETDAPNKLRNKAEEMYNQSYPGGHFSEGERPEGHPNGKNKRDVWEITTQPFSGSHFAVFPPELPQTCIKAGCPPKVCSECGKPYERESDIEREESYGRGNQDYTKQTPSSNAQQDVSGGFPEVIKRKTKKWKPTCDCDTEEIESGIVLDPFMGAGTTGLVARKLGRNWLGIEISEKYADMAERRIEQGDKTFQRLQKKKRKAEEHREKNEPLENFFGDK